MDRGDLLSCDHIRRIRAFEAETVAPFAEGRRSECGHFALKKSDKKKQMMESTRKTSATGQHCVLKDEKRVDRKECVGRLIQQRERIGRENNEKVMIIISDRCSLKYRRSRNRRCLLPTTKRNEVEEGAALLLVGPVSSRQIYTILKQTLYRQMVICLLAAYLSSFRSICRVPCIHSLYKEQCGHMATAHGQPVRLICLRYPPVAKRLSERAECQEKSRVGCPPFLSLLEVRIGGDIMTMKSRHVMVRWL